MNNNNLVTINDTMANLTDCCNSICQIKDTVNDVATTWMNMKRDIHQMDLQFNAYMGNLEVNLEKYKTSAPIVAKQLDGLQNIMSRILDRVLSMDAINEMQMQDKERMMSSLDSYIDRLATMMIKLL